MDDDEDRIKTELGSVISSMSKTFPDASRASADLWKFAKVHDRRNYQLIRFAMAASSDYRTVTKAIRELVRRIQSGNNATLLETLTGLLYRSSSLVFNRSHIPAVISISKTDEKGLTNAAHELLKVISSRNPEVLEAQVTEMCRDLEAQAPNASSTSAAERAGTGDILKACSGFAKKLPTKLPKERKFLQALVNYALYSSSPHSAKHAISILMVATDRKEMYAKDLVQKCVSGWKYGSDFFLTRLAALSQLSLLAPREADEESDTIISIAINQVLLTNRTPEPDSGYAWSDNVSMETSAKEWALKTIVNRLRAKEGSDDEDSFRAHSEPVFGMLVKLITDNGELLKQDTPASQKPRLRLLAARMVLKLCASHSLCDRLFTPVDFNSIALVAQDPLLAVRSGFVTQLTKKLAERKSYLSARWYTIAFLLAFEPNGKLKSDVYNRMRGRALFFAQRAQANGRKAEGQTVMELTFSRLLSLLAYHPDYPSRDLDEETKDRDLADFARYIVFYLSAVANEHNLSLIFHIAQRVKQARDGITESDEISTRLHTLSDLAQATIRLFADIYSHQHKFGGSAGVLQTYPGKAGLPSTLFTTMRSHREAQEVADTHFLPEQVDDMLEGIVRSSMKAPKSTIATAAGGHQNGATVGQAKKRKAASAATMNGTSWSANTGNKKAKTASTPRKPSGTSKAAARLGANNKQQKRKKMGEDEWNSDDDDDEGAVTSTAARRRSSRGTGKKGVSYADGDSDDDDVEMEEWNRGAEEEEGEKKRMTGTHVSEEDVDDDDEKENGDSQRNGKKDERKKSKAHNNNRRNVKKPATTAAASTKRSSRAKI